MTVRATYQSYVGERSVPKGTPFSTERVVDIICNDCGHQGLETDEAIWECPCTCHDSWKLIEDGGRYREQLERKLAGQGTKPVAG